MEKMWLVLSIVTFLIAVYHSIKNNVFDALYFYGFSVVAIAMYLMRRRLRLIQERQQKRKD